MPLLPLLLACGGGLAGTWAGEIPCADEDADGTLSASFTLEEEGEATYVGAGEIGFSGTFEISGAWREYVSTQTLDPVELTLDEDGEDVALEGVVVDCQTTIDGQDSDSGCGNDTVEWALTWDGGDALAYQEGDCDGQLVRQ